MLQKAFFVNDLLFKTVPLICYELQRRNTDGGALPATTLKKLSGAEKEEYHYDRSSFFRLFSTAFSKYSF